MPSNERVDDNHVRLWSNSDELAWTPSEADVDTPRRQNDLTDELASRWAISSTGRENTDSRRAKPRSGTGEPKHAKVCSDIDEPGCVESRVGKLNPM